MTEGPDSVEGLRERLKRKQEHHDSYVDMLKESYRHDLDWHKKRAKEEAADALLRGRVQSFLATIGGGIVFVLLVGIFATSPRQAMREQFKDCMAFSLNSNRAVARMDCMEATMGDVFKQETPNVR